MVIRMNSKKANWAFLVTILCYAGMVFAVANFFPLFAESLVFSNLICEIVVVLPMLVFIVASGENIVSFLGIHKMRFTSVLMTGLFTFLSVPSLTVVNLFSQLWVENEVASAMENMNAGQMPFGLLLFSTGLVAPVFEETLCRGAYYHAYAGSGRRIGAMVMSALIFALIHMNFNQASYAFVMGVFAVLLLEVTGSLWSCILYHSLINGSQMMLLYGAFKVNPNVYSEQAGTITPDFLLYAVGAYLVVVAVTLPLSWAVLVWISINEGRQGALSCFLPKKALPGKAEKKDKLVSVPFVLALILCIGMMTGSFFRIVEKIILMIR
ncbi:CPBP family intramembrane glutamic endopeptidase [Parablautia intestinalis]|jgi:membrane protease YdiL (CAAX protease family)|nr:type II CAAX endopeptidase family protein [Parablautia intestinalis]MCI8615282.1 CPBP family intramembrane metalloprotease [Lachnospiraceae bacterium]MDE7046651.1 CPBP family intramembrane metalloprotease [Lachnospiraceae bacterium]